MTSSSSHPQKESANIPIRKLLKSSVLCVTSDLCSVLYVLFIGYTVFSHEGLISRELELFKSMIASLYIAKYSDELGVEVLCEAEDVAY